MKKYIILVREPDGRGDEHTGEKLKGHRTYGIDERIPNCGVEVRVSHQESKIAKPHEHLVAWPGGNIER